MPDSSGEHLIMGALGAPYGLRGFNRLRSYTDPVSNILDYARQLFVVHCGDRCGIAAIRAAPHLLAQVEGAGDRDHAALHRGEPLYLERRDLPPPPPGEYYWSDLVGMRVVHAQSGKPLGEVARMMETGANDVLVVRDPAGAEALVPWIPGEVVRDVDAVARRLAVQWDADPSGAALPGRGEARS